MLRWPDLVVMGLFFLAFVGIGIAVSRKNKSAEAYFLAGRSLPGWLVGCSVMATIVSAICSFSRWGSRSRGCCRGDARKTWTI